MNQPADTPQGAEPTAPAMKPRFVLHLDGSIEPVATPTTPPTAED